MLCSICLDDINDSIMCFTNCNHSYCKTCLDKWFDKGNNSCPLCRGQIKYFKYQNETNRVIILNSNINNSSPVTLVYINKLKLQIFYLTLLFIFIIGLSIYTQINYNNTIELWTRKYNECNNNNTYMTGNQKYALLLYDSQYLQCRIPYYIIHDCIANNKK